MFKHAAAIMREAARHLLRRPVLGIVVAGRTRDGRYLLIRRADSGLWALPGGTLEWGETLKRAAEREVLEETGAHVESLADVVGVYSRPDRDPRFHAVTVVVRALVSQPVVAPLNPLEVREVSLFEPSQLPSSFSHGMADMLDDALSGRSAHWE